MIAFLVNFELTQAIIAHQNELGYIIHLLLVNLVAFESHRYDRKVKFRFSSKKIFCVWDEKDEFF